MIVKDIVTGASVKVLQVQPGACATLDQLEGALAEHRPAVVLVVHAESSTGVLQPLQGMGPLCNK